MKFCRLCGTELIEAAVICTTCGTMQEEVKIKRDKGGFLWVLLGFLVPIAGLVIYCVYKPIKPKTSNACGLGALIRALIMVVVLIVKTSIFIAL